MLDSLKNKLNSGIDHIKQAFTKNYTGKKLSLRYPLGDIEKHQNIVKFTALTRDQKSDKTQDFIKPEFVSSALGSVSLYMPGGLQINDNLSYDNTDTGAGGMMVNSYQGSASTSEFFKGVLKDAPQLADRFISQKLAEASSNKGLVGGVAGQLLINRGEVVNPHTQMLFRSPALRQFNFQFKLIPRSLSEAYEIRDIVKFFRLAAYPQLGNTEGGSLNMATYRFPDIFEIQYLTNSKDNPNLIKFQRSYLTSINVTYNQTSPTFFENGMPSEVDLSLTFQESKAISRNDIYRGY